MLMSDLGPPWWIVFAMAFLWNQSFGCAWFYCDGKQKLSIKVQTRYILGSILRQLSEILIKVEESQLERIEKLQAQARNSVDSKLAELFIDAILLISESFSKVYIVVDGIDECSAEGRPKLCESILRLAGGNRKVFLTSRWERDIAGVFGKECHLEMTEEFTSIDKALHIDWFLENDPKLKIRPDLLKNDIKASLLSQKSETQLPLTWN